MQVTKSLFKNLIRYVDYYYFHDYDLDWQFKHFLMYPCTTILSFNTCIDQMRNVCMIHVHKKMFQYILTNKLKCLGSTDIPHQLALFDDSCKKMEMAPSKTRAPISYQKISYWHDIWLHFIKRIASKKRLQPSHMSWTLKGVTASRISPTVQLMTE